MSQPLQGKVAVVTGSGRGIGRAIAERLAQQGAAVVIATRTVSHGEDAVNAIVAAGGQASLFPLDVSDKAKVFGLIEDTVARRKRLDIVVHAAADIPHAPILSLTDEMFDLCFTSIVKSSFWLAQASAPHLAKADGGRLVYISSVAGNNKTLEGLAHYGSAKSALNAFARGAAREFAPMGITVNTVDPGLIASARMRENVPREMEDAMAAGNLVKRAGTTQEVAAAVAYLVSAEAAFVTGSSLLIDGGSSLL
jgi:3-oxoacyl-[acyl-carrier protein] reductase